MIQNMYDFSRLTKIVSDEAVLWGNGTVLETDSSAAPMLKKYWKNVGVTNLLPYDLSSSEWQDMHPWSSVYISWVINQVDGTFPKSSAHRNYAKTGFNNRNSKKGGWTLYSLSREKKKIRAQVGDVLIKPRGVGNIGGSEKEKAAYNASHGDLVWKISDGIAYLSGGNLGNTNKTNIKINLNQDGSYPNKAGNYIVILKKI